MGFVSLGRLQEAIIFLKQFDLLEFNKEVCQLSGMYHFLLEEKGKNLDWDAFYAERNKISWSVLTIAELLMVRKVIIAFLLMSHPDYDH